jgi:PPM family protein phosphatase
VRRSARSVVIDFAELSDAGRDPTKQINEDASGYAETAHGHLAVVCDGMGGHSAGREAAQTAVRTIVAELVAAAPGVEPARALRASIQAAGRAVYAVGGDAPQELRPGSTCVAVLLHERGAEIAHAGDSRAYLVRAGQVYRLTRDHSMVQQMVDAGLLAPSEAIGHPDANKITTALGMNPEVDVELRPESLPIQVGDVFILMSDGLSDLVPDADLLAVVERSLVASGGAATCQQLVSLANERGGYDNITVQVLHVLEAPRVEAPADRTLIEPPAGQAAGPGPANRTEPGTPAAHMTITDGVPLRRAAPAPTLLDEPQRTTQPDLSSRDGLSGAAELAPRATQQGRLVVIIAAAIAVLIVGAVSVWWLARSISSKPAAPAPSASSGQPAPR